MREAEMHREYAHQVHAADLAAKAEFDAAYTQFVQLATEKAIPLKRITVIVGIEVKKIVGETSGWGPFPVGGEQWIAIHADGRYLTALDPRNWAMGYEKSDLELSRRMHSGEIVCVQDSVPDPWRGATYFRQSLAAYIANSGALG